MNIRTLIRVLARIRRQREHDRWPRERLLAYQAERLKALRAHAYTHSPFYQQFHRGLMDRPLAELPVLTKAMLMEHFDELVTDRALRLEAVEAHVANMRGPERFHRRYWVNATSGSTGRRGLFVFNAGEWEAVLASFARARDWAGGQITLTRRMRMASVASTTPWHMSALAAATFQSWWVPALRLDASEPMATIVGRLNAWQPEMLVAYASMAALLAEEQRGSRLRIAPRMIFPSSEVLTAEMRNRLEGVWGPVIFEQYAATETAGIAAECTAHHGLHLFEDLVITEVVDRDNRPVPPGVYGDKLLVTVLFNRTQPLIRYELSDSVRLAVEPPVCSMPYRLIAGIQGRTEDILHFPGRAGGEVTVQPGVLHRVMDLYPAGAWQIVRKPDGLYVLLVDGRDGVGDSALADMLRRAISDQGAQAPMVQVRHVSAIPKGVTGKTRLIVA